METEGIPLAGQVGQHALSRPRLNDSDTYRMMVLRFEQSEEDFDEELAHTALDLGIEVPLPSSPKSTVDMVATDVSTLEISPVPPEPPITPESSVKSSSHTSESIHAQSDSSIEYKRHAKSPSLTATSITSVASVSSIASQNSHYARVKKGIRRISTLRRPVQHRASTADEVPTSAKLQPHALTTDESPTAAARRRQVNSVSYTPATYNAQPPRPPPPHQEPHPTPDSSQDHIDLESVPPLSPSTLEAQHRSINHPGLKKLRTTHLQEQLRFISFQASQTRLLHTGLLQAKRSALTAYKARQLHLETTHADALVNLEHRHLSAEVDLRKGLEAERRGCDVKLKHMQAYCNPRSTIEGMPRRDITKADYRQLEQQYLIRDGMENLHTSKINVLREKQAKQLERILAKQEAVLAEAEADFEQENLDLEQRFREEGENQEMEFAQRKKRLVRRWGLQESIERRKLELETEIEYGKLPDIAWGEEGVLQRRNSSQDSVMSIERTGEVDTENDEPLEGMEKAKYDAMNMI